MATVSTDEIIAAARLTYDDDGRPIVHTATCGTCGRSWNDAAISSITPTPAGRCPWEAEHDVKDESVTEDVKVWHCGVCNWPTINGQFEWCNNCGEKGTCVLGEPLDWANVPDPGDVPDAKLSTWRTEDQNATRILARIEGDSLNHIADLKFEDGAWRFYRLGKAGQELDDGTLLDVDPQAEEHLRLIEGQARIDAKNETVLDAQLAAVEVKRVMYREESRTLAEIAAFIQARRWWRIWYSQ